MLVGKREGSKSPSSAPVSSLFYELWVIAAASVSVLKGKPQLPPASLCSSLSSVSVCYPGCLKVTASALGLGSCAVLYVPFRSRVFVSYSPWLSCVQAPLALKLHVLEAHLPCAGVPKVGLGPLTLWRDVYYCDCTPAVCCLSGGVVLDLIMPSYPSCCGSFFIPSVVDSP